VADKKAPSQEKLTETVKAWSSGDLEHPKVLADYKA
jgi:hypothetical protein